MEFDKVISYFEKHIGEYLGLLYRTLTKPTQSFRETIACSSLTEKPIIETFSAIYNNFKLKLASMVVISLAAGTVFNTLVPTRKYSSSFLNYAVVTLYCWCFFAILSYATSRLLKGSASLVSTIWVSFQLFSSIYLLSSFLNLLGGAIVKLPAINMLLVSSGRLGDSVANNPVYIYFLCQFVLFNIYLPIALKQLNHFGWIRTAIIVLVIGSCWFFLGYALYGDRHIHYWK